MLPKALASRATPGRPAPTQEVYLCSRISTSIFGPSELVRIL